MDEGKMANALCGGVALRGFVANCQMFAFESVAADDRRRLLFCRRPQFPP